MVVCMREVPARPWVDVCVSLALSLSLKKGPLKNIILGTYFRNFTVYQVESPFLGESSFFKPRPPDNSNQITFTMVVRA